MVGGRYFLHHFLKLIPIVHDTVPDTGTCSIFSHTGLASDYLTECHQALFFQQDTLAY